MLKKQLKQSNNELFQLFYIFFSTGAPTLGNINILRSI